MDTSKIGGPNFFPEKPIGKTDSVKKSSSEKKVEGGQVQSAEENEWGNVFKLPPHKLVSKLTGLLEKSLSDPKVEKLMLENKIPTGSKQALAFCTYSCIKQLLGNKFALNAEDEKALIEAIQQEYEEDAKQPIDPDEKKRRRRERRKKSKPKVNAIMTLLQESIKNLERNSGGGFSLKL